MKKFLCGLLIASGITSLRAENWPAWRGPTGNGVSAEKELPLKWDALENVKWRVPLSERGNSTPVIWGDKVFITQAGDLKLWPPKVPDNFAGGSSAGGHAIAEKRSVLCFNRADGKLLWQRDVIYKEPEITHPTNPFSAASPVTDGDRVIASHNSAGLVCYDFEGKELWRYDVGKLEHLWGTASSPILYGEFGKDRLDQSGILVGAFQTCPDSHDCLSSDVDNAALSCLGPSALSSGAIPMKVDI